MFQLAQEGKTEYFKYNETKEGDVVNFCASIMEVSTTSLVYQGPARADDRFLSAIKRDFGTNFAAVSDLFAIV